MRIDHVALFTRDLEQTRAFFVRYFGAQAGEAYRNPRTGLQTYFLTFDTQTRLELMTLPALTEPSAAYPQAGLTHLALGLNSRQAVNELTERLRKDGYAVVSEPRVTGDGYYESCVLGPEGCRLELTESPNGTFPAAASRETEVEA